MSPENIFKLKKRPPDTDKGDYGHVFVLAGSTGYTGAAYLCAQAAILSGSGLVTSGIPKSLNTIMAVKLTEVMTKPLPETAGGSFALTAFDEIVEIAGWVDVIAIGPGLSQNSETQLLVKRLITNINRTMVIDADGINALAEEVDVLKHRNAPCILTPHPGEFARLLDISKDDVQKERLRLAVEFARKYNLIFVLKGHETVVVNGSGDTYINKTGNPGMATAGCGDVLTGIIASFVGQGMTAFEAARLAVYVHGKAGDLAAKEKGELSLIASDILTYLPYALKEVVE